MSEELHEDFESMKRAREEEYWHKECVRYHRKCLFLSLYVMGLTGIIIGMILAGEE